MRLKTAKMHREGLDGWHGMGGIGRGHCESMNNEHFRPNNSFPTADLFDLVNSFERDYNHNRTRKIAISCNKDFEESKGDKVFEGERLELEKPLKEDDEGVQEEQERISYLLEQAFFSGIGERSADGFERV
ncbi:unnamed protein product [Linum trigynum]